MMQDNLGVLVALGGLYKAWELGAETLSKSLGVPLCVEGCGICCKNVPISYGVEAAYAMSLLIGEGRLKEMLSRAEGWLLDRHKEAPTYEPVRLGKVTREQYPKLQEEHEALGRTFCPFLDETKRCLVYGCRPLPCRAFSVTRAAPPVCQRPLGKGELPGRKAYLGADAARELKKVLDAILRSVPKPTLAMAGFFPSMLYALGEPTKYRMMVTNNSVATTKVLITSPSMALLWQEDQERMWAEPTKRLAPI